MLEACREIGIPAVSLWAAVPHYLAANPNPTAMLALLSKAQDVLEVDLETTELAAAASEFQTKVDEAMAENEDFTVYVQRLENQSADISSIDPSGSIELISEIENFLKGR
jgi:hypothetical protein